MQKAIDYSVEDLNTNEPEFQQAHREHEVTTQKVIDALGRDVYHPVRDYSTHQSVSQAKLAGAHALCDRRSVEDRGAKEEVKDVPHEESHKCMAWDVGQEHTNVAEIIKASSPNKGSSSPNAKGTHSPNAKGTHSPNGKRGKSPNFRIRIENRNKACADNQSDNTQEQECAQKQAGLNRD